MKKLRLNPRSLLKLLLAATLFALYWYWINKKLISDGNQTFGLTGFFLLMSTATAYFPIPANLLVLGAVKNTDPLLVAIVGGGATLVAYLSEYIFFTVLFKFNRVASFKDTWIYEKLGPLFDNQKFAILTFASFLPIPSEALRIYAITRKYSRVGYMLAGFIGRVPRYYLLGYYGKDYVNSVWFLAAVFLFPAVFLLTIRGTVGLVNAVRKWQKRSEQGALPVAMPPGAAVDMQKPGLDEPGA